MSTLSVEMSNVRVMPIIESIEPEAKAPLPSQVEVLSAGQLEGLLDDMDDDLEAPALSQNRESMKVVHEFVAREKPIGKVAATAEAEDIEESQTAEKVSDAGNKTPLRDFYAKGKKASQAIEIKDVDEIIEPTKSQEKKKTKSNFKFKKPKAKEVIENDESVFEKERLGREAEATAAAASKDRIDLEEAIVAS